MKIINGREVLIAAHRGVAGGNIPGNTSVAFEIALAQGADIIELDVAKNADGELFVFHPKIEPVHLRSEKLIADMTTEEVLNQRFVNRDQAFTEYGVEYFSAVMKNIKGRNPSICKVKKEWLRANFQKLVYVLISSLIYHSIQRCNIAKDYRPGVRIGVRFVILISCSLKI